MSDQTNDFRFKIINNSIRCFAIVNIDVSPNLSGLNEIIENYSGKGFYSQGYIEEVPKSGYQSWKHAAIKGLEFAFSIVDTNWTVQINKIAGLSFTDTNPAIVGYTIMMAFFDKIGLQFDIEQMGKIEDLISRSWNKPYKELIPDFFNLTFTEYK
ncbi:hypothetical protein [Chitinophaga sancti]|uniref:Uncharacterized protein n=1 Tax=Chitinophaga sancti TaxID=1004 RepID=A0A1K1S017_9BACT|nr:hypothetical protein [Chitinophaga sancti]WQD59783.1 hypothetical protein U0033_17990 [Chitinophaga sancti]WQG88086.1 hypothetical protein SR876_24475 [Chitinophaga sancti]SFW77760.1 hypothetical protein SAMN05661012_04514 [Chitinophaga sancti]